MIRVPARPIRSSARRISGAKITGTASNNAGNEFCTSHENAGRFTRLVIRTSTTTIRITPRNKTMACVPRSQYSKP